MRKLLAILFLSMFLISFASAWEFDNVKSYDAQTKTATITNAFGLGEKIADVQLKSNQHEQVGLGYQKVFEYQIDSKTLYNNFIQELEIYDLKKGAGTLSNKKVDLKYLVYEDVEVIDYKDKCTDEEDIMKKSCISEKIGSHIEKQEVWKDLEKMDVKAEKITISGWTEVNQGDYYEWIPEFAGSGKIFEWATWQGNLSNGLMRYYEYEETGAVVIDSTNTQNGTNNSLVYKGVTGKIGNAYNFTENSFCNIDGVSSTAKNYTFNTWVKPTGVNAGDGQFLFDLRGTGLMLIQLSGNTCPTQFAIHDGSGHRCFGGSMTNNVWQMVTFTMIGTNMSVWVNGTYSASTTYSPSTSDWGATSARIGGDNGGGTANMVGLLDESSMWNRSLSASEIAWLYNGYAGCSLNNESCFTPPDTSPTITLNSPDNAYTSSSYSNTFTCTGTDDIKVQNISFYVNGTINQTNTSVFNNSVTTFSTTLAEGLYNWTCGACDNSTAGQCTNATPRTITISIGSPVVTLNSPVNAYNSTLSSIDFNCSVVDGYGVQNMSLMLNGILNQTNTSGMNNTNYYFTKSLAEGLNNWSCRASNIYKTTTAGYRNLTINTTPFIEFLTPPTLIDHANITQEYIPMKVNVSTSYYKNITYSLRDVNGTNYTLIFTNETYDINFTNMPDAHYHYDVVICTTTDKCNITETRHINHDNSPPEILVTGGNGTQNSGKLSINHTLNYNITDPHLSACLLNYNYTNRTIPCTSGTINTTNFILQSGLYNATIWANDTYNNTYGRFVEWNYNIFENNRTYNPTTIETFTEAFFLNVSLGSGVTISSAYLNYNGTDYGSSIATSGDYKIINNNVNIPGVSTETNISFYWKLTLSSGNFNTSSSNQTISTLAIDNCGVYTHVILNYTIYDEDTRIFLPTATYNTSANLFVKISGDFSGGVFEYYSGNILTNPIQVCTTNSLIAGKNYKLDAEIQYFSADRVSEFHYIENYSLNTTIGTLNISLYDLLINNSQEFLVTFKDNNFIPVEGALIELSRQYLSLGGFLSVEIMKTDNDGKTIGHFVLNDEVYTLYVKKNGVLLAVYENVRAFCSDLVTGDCRINLNQAGSTSNPISFESYLGVIGLETYNDTSKSYSFQFTTEDSSTKTVNVTIFNYPNLNETICSEVLSSSSGTISCIIPPAYYNNSALAVITIDGEEYSSSIFQIILDSFSEVSSMKFFLAFLMIISIPFLAMSSGPMMLLLFIVGLVASVSLGLLDLGGFIGPFSAFLWILVAVIILMVKASERRQQQ